jgi:HSP20 family protein
MRAVNLFAELDSLIRASQFSPALRVAVADDSAISFAMDAVETDTAYIVKANLPGIVKENVVIDVNGKTVNISASPSAEPLEADGQTVLRRERYLGKFERQFTLQHEIDADNIQAKLEHGVLTVSLNKRSPVIAKRITVQ